MPRSRSRWILLPIAACSGFAGLGYEMVWTRELSLALGSDMLAVLGAVAAFFGGLALGAFALDGPIRRARSPRLSYAILEAAIGFWGLASLWLLPHAARLLPPLLGTEPSPIALWAASFAWPALLLLPATFAMGGTLTALERMLAASSAEPRVSALVYGTNTAGAVAGTLISVLFLFPAVGLSGTLLALSVLNGACALAALVLAPTATAQPAEPLAVPGPALRSLRLDLVLFVTGLLGIGVEVLIVRIAAQALQNTIYSFAALLAAYLLGTALGGLIWQRVARRTGEASEVWLITLTALACLASAALAPQAMRVAARASYAGLSGELLVALVLFLAPSTAMGALFAQLAQRVRDARGSLGRAVGINSLGAALAPLIASLLLIPSLGAWKALVLLAALYLLLLPPQRSARRWALLPLCAAAVLLLMPPPLLIRVPEGGHVVALREGPMSTASVVDDVSGARYLEVNGHFRMGGTSSMRSDYRQAMLPLLVHPSPRRALFLGIGTGATLVGGSRMPGVAVRGVDLSPEVVELLPWFADPARPPPPVSVADARRWVLADRTQYDVIIADLYHPALDGSGALYTPEHFAAVRERLAPGGIFCQWLPLYQLDMPSLRAIVRGFLEVYPSGSAWLAHFSVRTPMLALIGGRGPLRLDEAMLAARLADPQVAPMVRPVGFESPIDVLGQFLAGPAALATFAGKGPRNTDDYPFVALDAERNVRALSAPPAALLMAVNHLLRTDPAELLAAGAPATLAARLTAYWGARDQFLQAGARLTGDPRGLALVAAASPGLLDAVHVSAEFEPAYRPLISMAQALLSSDRDAAARLLREIDRAAPARSEARELLAREFGE